MNGGRGGEPRVRAAGGSRNGESRAAAAGGNRNSEPRAMGSSRNGNPHSAAAGGSWKDDPRVKAMNPQKVAFLTELAAQVEQTPRSQIMGRFLAMTLEADRKGISFSDQETEILAGILADYMDPAARGKIDLLRMLSRRMAAGARKRPDTSG